MLAGSGEPHSTTSCVFSGDPQVRNASLLAARFREAGSNCSGMDEGQRWDVRDRTSSRVSGTASPNRTHCHNLLRYGSLLGNEHDSLSGSANLDKSFE